VRALVDAHFVHPAAGRDHVPAQVHIVDLHIFRSVGNAGGAAATRRGASVRWLRYRLFSFGGRWRPPASVNRRRGACERRASASRCLRS
jgi:hypothetical protein